MKRLAALLTASLLAVGCGLGWVLHPIDPMARGFDKRDKTPELFIKLSTADQVCAGPDGTAKIVVFVTQRFTSPKPVRLTLNNSLTFDLVGETVVLELDRLGVGGHTIVAEAGDLRSEKSWSVWQCQAQAR